MNKTIIVKRCYRSCPFYNVDSEGMNCSHPYFDDKQVYDNMIITHDNSYDTLPEKCPLRFESLTIKYIRGNE